MEEILALMRAEKVSRIARTMIPTFDNNNLFEKGIAAQEGEVREWKGQKFKKQGGKWVPVTAPRKQAPISGKKSQDAKKEEIPQGKKTLEKPTPTPQVSTADLGQLKRIKKLIASGDMKSAGALASGLGDNAKNIIPADAWEKMHESTSPMGSDQKKNSREKDINQDKNERFKSWVSKNKDIFDTGEHIHPDRSKASKFLRGKVKGFVQGLKHEMDHIQHAGSAIKKALSGKMKDISDHEKAALKKVGISLGMTAATMLATGGIGAFAHGFGTVASHLGIHFAEHGLIETAAKTIAFAKGESDELSDNTISDKELEDLSNKFIDWFEKGDWSDLQTDTKEK